MALSITLYHRKIALYHRRIALYHKKNCAVSQKDCVVSQEDCAVSQEELRCLTERLRCTTGRLRCITGAPSRHFAVGNSQSTHPSRQNYVLAADGCTPFTHPSRQNVTLPLLFVDWEFASKSRLTYINLFRYFSLDQGSAKRWTSLVARRVSETVAAPLFQTSPVGRCWGSVWITFTKHGPSMGHQPF